MNNDLDSKDLVQFGSGAKHKLPDQKFMEIADRFIEVANQENQTVDAADLHLAFLYAASRYNAHVGKNVFHIGEHEQFVHEMLNTYREMLRKHLSDSSV